MPFSVKKLSGEPVVIVTIALPIEQHIPAFRVHMARMAHLVTEHGAPLYRVLDLRGQEPAFSDIVLLLDELKLTPPGSLADARFHNYAVGDHPLIGVGIKKLEQRLGLRYRWCESLDEALHHIRASLSQE